MAGGQSTEAAPWRRVVELATLVAVPVPVLTALLYYFGFVRAQVICGYFGIEVSLLGYSVPDYVLRSARVVFDPLAVLALTVLVGIAAHLALMWGLRRLPPHSRWCRAAAPVIAGTAVLLFAAALEGLGRLPGGPGLVSQSDAAVTLGLGSVLIEYAVYLAEEQRLRRWRQRRSSRRRRTQPPPPLMAAPAAAARRMVVAGLILIALFWGFTVEAARQGGGVAYDIARTIPTRPETIVYTKERLQLTGYGMTATALPSDGSDWRFRYTGLHILLYSGKRWFLLPTDWRQDNGAPVVILNDDPASLRVDMRP